MWQLMQYCSVQTSRWRRNIFTGSANSAVLEDVLSLTDILSDYGTTLLQLSDSVQSEAVEMLGTLIEESRANALEEIVQRFQQHFVLLKVAKLTEELLLHSPEKLLPKIEPIIFDFVNSTLTKGQFSLHTPAGRSLLSTAVKKLNSTHKQLEVHIFICDCQYVADIFQFQTVPFSMNDTLFQISLQSDYLMVAKNQHFVANIDDCYLTRLLHNGAMGFSETTTQALRGLHTECQLSVIRDEPEAETLCFLEAVKINHALNSYAIWDEGFWFPSSSILIEKCGSIKLTKQLPPNSFFTPRSGCNYTLVGKLLPPLGMCLEQFFSHLPNCTFSLDGFIKGIFDGHINGPIPQLAELGKEQVYSVVSDMVSNLQHNTENVRNYIKQQIASVQLSGSWFEQIKQIVMYAAVGLGCLIGIVLFVVLLKVIIRLTHSKHLDIAEADRERRVHFS